MTKPNFVASFNLRSDWGTFRISPDKPISPKKTMSAGKEMKICVFTLGCKVNFYESDSLINMLKEKGYDTTNKLEFSDVYVLNTCCVTNEGESVFENEFM